jgi:hypothetical protein
VDETARMCLRSSCTASRNTSTRALHRAILRCSLKCPQQRQQLRSLCNVLLPCRHFLNDHGSKPRYCTAWRSLEHAHRRTHLNPPHILYSAIVSIFRPVSRGRAKQSAGHAVSLHQKDRAMSGMPQIADGRAKPA